MEDDGLSEMHFRTVRAEIEGRFFTNKEADTLKKMLDERVITDSQVRTMAAISWEGVVPR